VVAGSAVAPGFSSAPAAFKGGATYGALLDFGLRAVHAFALFTLKAGLLANLKSAI
jgi:hypothetical protein